MKPNEKFLIVGLGNPGKKYERTRHNLGFMVVDSLVEHQKASEFALNKNFDALMSESKQFIFMKPQTFMNLSGDSVQSFLSFYKIPTQHLLVIYDDLDLMPLQMKLKFEGGVAGQKGATDIMAKIGSDQFARLRLGIGKPPIKGMEVSNYVLGKLLPDEVEYWKEATPTVFESIMLWSQGNNSKAQQIINSYQLS